MEFKPILSWTLFSECSIPSDINQILVNDEKPIAAYKTFRDSAIFTNKRLIIRDVQGVTGKKIESYSLPYSSILMWSSENAGIIDINSEIELWTRVGQIKICLRKDIDIRKFDRIISDAILNNKEEE